MRRILLSMSLVLLGAVLAVMLMHVATIGQETVVPGPQFSAPYEPVPSPYLAPPLPWTPPQPAPSVNLAAAPSAGPAPVVVPQPADPAAEDLAQLRQQFHQLASKYAELADAETLRTEIDRMKSSNREAHAKNLLTGAAENLDALLKRYPETEAAKVAERMKAAAAPPSAPEVQKILESEAIGTIESPTSGVLFGASLGVAEEAAEKSEAATQAEPNVSAPLGPEEKDSPE